MNQSGLDELLEREFSVLTQKEHRDTKANPGGGRGSVGSLPHGLVSREGGKPVAFQI